MSKFIFVVSIIITIFYSWLLQALYSLSESFLVEGYGLHPAICFCVAVLTTGLLVIVHITTYHMLTERK